MSQLSSIHKGNELKIMREGADISEIEMAGFLSINLEDVSNLEKGLITVPDDIYKQWTEICVQKNEEKSDDDFSSGKLSPVIG